jgi:hypothetical protein
VNQRSRPAPTRTLAGSPLRAQINSCFVPVLLWFSDRLLPVRNVPPALRRFTSLLTERWFVRIFTGLLAFDCWFVCTEFDAIVVWALWERMWR